MSGHQYISNPNNLFEDDIDDETFLKNSRINSPTISTNPFEQQKQTYEQKRQEIESRTFESSQRSLGLLYETEEVGKATATELSKQREQLEKSNRQLDEISATLRFSQKHLNGLKSVFGGLKNYLSGNRDMPPPSGGGGGSRMTSSTSNGKIAEEESEITPEERYNSHPINRIRNGPIEQMEERVQRGTTYDQRLEQNLDDMCGSLSRLKGLANDLQTEIVTQNDLIDNMTYKMEDADLKVTKQNKEMNKLLGKK